MEIYEIELEHIIFYQQLGIAITNWAHVEWAIFAGATICLESANTIESPDYKAIKQAYFAIENFRSKLDFTNKLICEKFSKSAAFPEWGPLLERIKRASSKRNKLVHRTAFNYIDGGAWRRLALAEYANPGPQRKSKFAKPPPHAFTLRDIMEISEEFSALHYAIYNFYARVRGLKAPYPKSREQAQRPPAIPSKVRQIRAALAPRPSPSRKKS